MHEQRKKPLLLYIYRDWLKLSKPNFLISLAHLMVIHVMQEYEKILIQWVPHFIGQSRALTPWDKINPPHAFGATKKCLPLYLLSHITEQ